MPNMTPSRQTGTFDTFNARNLRADEVAKTFVPSSYYHTLAKSRHTLVVGPRGSGKTTLLKMLQQSALECWDHELADGYRNSIPFTGVFIPTDITWNAQLTALGQELGNPETERIFSQATFCAHVLRALTTAMVARVHPSSSSRYSFRRVEMDASQEAKIVQQIGKAWHLKDVFPTLPALKQSLSARLVQIRAEAVKEVMFGINGRTDRLLADESLTLAYFPALLLAIELFNDSVKEPEGLWALLFDELELAPEWIQDELLRYLRSTDSRVVFKVALSPFNVTQALREATSGAPGQDYDQVPLWYVEKDAAYSFCEAIWYAMLGSRRRSRISPREALGKSFFETSPDTWKEKGTAYHKESEVARVFRDLAAKDRSFRQYLANRDLDPNKWDAIDGNRRAAEIRKIQPIVAIRNFYRGKDKSSLKPGKGRSRKTSILYAGAESLFAVSEGNPRILIAILSNLLDQWPETQAQISPELQAQEMRKAGQRFEAMLATLPVPLRGTGPKHITTLELLRETAEYLKDQVIREHFQPEPPATFIADKDLSESAVSSLAAALNAGGIVYIPEGGTVLVWDIFRKRFRLSYLLAMLHGVPIRLGRELNLTTIVPAASRSYRLRNTSEPYLPLLEEDRE